MRLNANLSEIVGVVRGNPELLDANASPREISFPYVSETTVGDRAYADFVKIAAYDVGRWQDRVGTTYGS